MDYPRAVPNLLEPSMDMTPLRRFRLPWKMWIGKSGYSLEARTPVGNYYIQTVMFGFSLSYPDPFRKSFRHGTLDVVLEVADIDFNMAIRRSDNPEEIPND
jgi:hypothetical protein